MINCLFGNVFKISLCSKFVVDACPHNGSKCYVLHIENTNAVLSYQCQWYLVHVMKVNLHLVPGDVWC